MTCCYCTRKMPADAVSEWFCSSLCQRMWMMINHSDDADEVFGEQYCQTMIRVANTWAYLEDTG